MNRFKIIRLLLLTLATTFVLIGFYLNYPNATFGFVLFFYMLQHLATRLVEILDE